MKKKTIYKKKVPKIKKRDTLLPHNYRIISAFPRFYLIITLCFIGFFTLILSISLFFLIHSYTVTRAERNAVIERLQKTQEIIKAYPDQSGAYYTAALFAIQLKDYDTAKEYLIQALSLNPEMSEAKKILEAVEERN